MPHGKSATNSHSEFSEVDIDALKVELRKLQMQFRTTQGDRQAYSIQSQELIRKQHLEIEKLQEEQLELLKNLRVSEGQSHHQTDNYNSQQLQALLNCRDKLDKKLGRERLSQAELERDIQGLQKKLEELRKKNIGTFLRQRFQNHYFQKTTQTLENKLDWALVCLDEQLARNNKLDEDLMSLKVEHVHFEQLYSKLYNELQEIQQEIGTVISMATASYDARVDAQTKITMMKEKAVKDLDQYNSEMKELERHIAHEQCLKHFMTTKCKKKTKLEDALSHRQGIKEQRRTDSEVAADTLEDVFQQIQKVTGEDDWEVLVTKFVQDEDRNFALFNYVNEQNTQAKALKNQIGQIKVKMERFKVQEMQQELDYETNLKHMEEQQRDAEAQALDYTAQMKEMTKLLDQIKAGVSDVFNSIDFDQEAVDDLLSSSPGIRDNIMMYLSLVEQKTNELLTLQAFINSKHLGKDFDVKLVSQMLLGQSSEMVKQAHLVQIPLSGDENDIEESLMLYDDDKPLPQEELRQRIMSALLRKEESLHTGRNKKAKSIKHSALSSHGSAPSCSKKKILHESHAKTDNK